MGGATGACGGTTYPSPHFCGLYPARGTTQFTLYTCGVLQLAVLQMLRNSHSALALKNSVSCTVCYYDDSEHSTYIWNSVPESRKVNGRIATSHIRNQVISNVTRLQCTRWFVKLFGGNRTLCLPHCLSLFGMFSYRPINARARPLRYCSNAVR